MDDKYKSKLYDSNCIKYKKHFSGTKMACIQDCIKPSLWNKPDHFINNLATDASSEEIAAAAINVATLLKEWTTHSQYIEYNFKRQKEIKH